MKYKMIILYIILVGIFGTIIFSQIYEKNEKNNINNSSSINTNKTNETNYTTKGNTTIVPLERPPFIDEIEETEK